MLLDGSTPVSEPDAEASKPLAVPLSQDARQKVIDVLTEAFAQLTLYGVAAFEGCVQAGYGVSQGTGTTGSSPSMLTDKSLKCGMLTDSVEPGVRREG